MILHTITAVNTIASVHITLLNDSARSLFFSNRSASLLALSPDAVSVLESSRDAFQNSRDIDFGILSVMTVFVAVGVILEGPELLRELYAMVARWYGREVGERPPDWIKFIGLIGWAMVSIGVAGEFWADNKLDNDDDNIQSVNIALTRDASASASKAQYSVQQAKDALGEVEKRSAVLNERMNEASSKLDVFEGRLAWRTVSKEQARKIREMLNAFRGRTIVIRWEEREEEQAEFATHLMSALQPEIHVVPSPVPFDSSPPYPYVPQGITLGIRIAGSNNDDFMDAVERALVCADVARFPVHKDANTSPELVMWIRPKERGPINKQANKAACAALLRAH